MWHGEWVTKTPSPRPTRLHQATTHPSWSKDEPDSDCEQVTMPCRPEPRSPSPCRALDVP
jgi:hypothetical protein